MAIKQYLTGPKNPTKDKKDISLISDYILEYCVHLMESSNLPKWSEYLTRKKRKLGLLTMLEDSCCFSNISNMLSSFNQVFLDIKINLFLIRQ